ncbi:cellulose synthase-like protein E1 [Euphorbia lathyris]|uniref:cellulose synthase-like protein E1 n=1 Tax=Euphorbia lathyris TaxID=212925 RepID=UPI0033137FCC
MEPLFETKSAKGNFIYRGFTATVFLGIIFIWFYRFINIPRKDEDGRCVWIGLLASEIWFGIYWILTQSLRWNQIHRFTFKDALSRRYENELPRVDVFVCTADATIEPPIMVVNTVLSVMTYDYPPEKLGVYLSDDGGSELTFYALMEAAEFARLWIPYCRKWNVGPRSPAAYFVTSSSDSNNSTDLAAIKQLYGEMEERIETATKLGRIPEEVRLTNRGFSHWNSYSSRHDHDTILQILIDREDTKAIDIEGCALPTLVYLAREKRPQHPHNFKAGAMNALLRVSSKISNGQVILNLDCDMYLNNSQSLRDALCFFMDEKQNHDIAFVQFPQCFANITKNDLYGSSMPVISNVEFHGLDGVGGPMYIGSGCFHRRDILYGKKYGDNSKLEWRRQNDHKREESLQELEAVAKPLASCTCEQNTEWGNEMGLKYGCPVEDVITGLSIQCKGWKSVYFNPERKAFLGIAPTTLPQTLVQHKRWSEGDFQIMFSKYSPLRYANGKISLGLQMCYCCYCFWAPNCLATLYYSTIPSLFLLKGTSLFPQVSSPWFLPFAYVICSSYIYSLVEFMLSGGTFLGWWNEQRMWLYKRTTSYLFGFTDTILKLMGFSELDFVITTKVADEDVSKRYEKEIMEFGISSPMLIILTALAILNLVCFVGVLKQMVSNENAVEKMVLQIVLCCGLVLINLPIYQGFLLRKDKGKLPYLVTVKSFVLAAVVCSSFTLLY